MLDSIKIDKTALKLLEKDFEEIFDKISKD